MTKPRLPTAADPATLVALPSDPTGAQTFGRYRWQAKIALQRWLGTLAPGDVPQAVVCEQIDDIVVVYADRYVFQQLKTRDRGSWSAAKVCAKKGGLDALIRSWKAAHGAGLDDCSTFELWLEGPMSEVPTTVTFFADPTSAGTDVRKALVKRGLSKAQLDAFLSRLSIHANTTPRGAIDPVLHHSVGALWPSLTHAQAAVLVERLLQAAEAGQAHEQPSVTVLQHLRARASTGPSAADPDDTDTRLAPVLSRGMLQALTPPLPDEPNDVLLQRLGRGQPSSALELKLQRAGAKAPTVQRAIELRAEADVQRQLTLAASGGTSQHLDELGSRVLLVAQGAAAHVELRMTDPLVAASPGEYVFNHFLANPGALATLDHQQLLGAQGLLLLGLLCQLSDECRFGWRP